MRFLWISLVICLLQACGGDVTDDNFCPIDCSSTFSGKSGVNQVTVVNSSSQQYQCINIDDPTPVTVRFLISKDNSAGTSSVEFDDNEKANLNLQQQPLPRIAFTPLLEGVRDASKTNPTIVDVCDGCEGTPSAGSVVKVSPYQFHGITTPKSEWCSDSCGVASYTFIPKCGPGGSDSIDASILFTSISGTAGSSEDAATISVSILQPELDAP